MKVSEIEINDIEKVNENTKEIDYHFNCLYNFSKEVQSSYYLNPFKSVICNAYTLKPPLLGGIPIYLGNYNNHLKRFAIEILAMVRLLSRLAFPLIEDKCELIKNELNNLLISIKNIFIFDNNDYEGIFNNLNYLVFYILNSLETTINSENSPLKEYLLKDNKYVIFLGKFIELKNISSEIKKIKEQSLDEFDYSNFKNADLLLQKISEIKNVSFSGLSDFPISFIEGEQCFSDIISNFIKEVSNLSVKPPPFPLTNKAIEELFGVNIFFSTLEEDNLSDIFEQSIIEHLNNSIELHNRKISEYNEISPYKFSILKLNNPIDANENLYNYSLIFMNPIVFDKKPRFCYQVLLSINEFEINNLKQSFLNLYDDNEKIIKYFLESTYYPKLLDMFVSSNVSVSFQSILRKDINTYILKNIENRNLRTVCFRESDTYLNIERLIQTQLSYSENDLISPLVTGHFMFNIYRADDRTHYYKLNFSNQLKEKLESLINPELIKIIDELRFTSSYLDKICLEKKIINYYKQNFDFKKLKLKPLNKQINVKEINNIFTLLFPEQKNIYFSNIEILDCIYGTNLLIVNEPEGLNYNNYLHLHALTSLLHFNKNSKQAISLDIILKISKIGKTENTSIIQKLDYFLEFLNLFPFFPKIVLFKDYKKYFNDLEKATQDDFDNFTKLSEIRNKYNSDTFSLEAIIRKEISPNLEPFVFLGIHSNLPEELTLFGSLFQIMEASILKQSSIEEIQKKNEQLKDIFRFLDHTIKNQVIAEKSLFNELSDFFMELNKLSNENFDNVENPINLLIGYLKDLPDQKLFQSREGILKLEENVNLMRVSNNEVNTYLDTAKFLFKNDSSFDNSSKSIISKQTIIDEVNIYRNTKLLAKNNIMFCRKWENYPIKLIVNLNETEISSELKGLIFFIVTEFLNNAVKNTIDPEKNLNFKVMHVDNAIASIRQGKIDLNKNNPQLLEEVIFIAKNKPKKKLESFINDKNIVLLVSPEDFKKGKFDKSKNYIYFISEEKSYDESQLIKDNFPYPIEQCEDIVIKIQLNKKGFCIEAINGISQNKKDYLIANKAVIWTRGYSNSDEKRDFNKSSGNGLSVIKSIIEEKMKGKVYEKINKENKIIIGCTFNLP